MSRGEETARAHVHQALANAYTFVANAKRLDNSRAHDVCFGEDIFWARQWLKDASENKVFVSDTSAQEALEKAISLCHEMIKKTERNRGTVEEAH